MYNQGRAREHRRIRHEERQNADHGKVSLRHSPSSSSGPAVLLLQLQSLEKPFFYSVQILGQGLVLQAPGELFPIL